MPVFENVSFTLKSGDCMTITGANGSGKSSLLRIMAGLLKPASRQCSGYELEEIHYIGAQSGLRAILTLQENLNFWAKMLGNNKSVVLKAMQAMNISHLAKEPISRLSSGQAKRASLAKLYIVKRPIWLLDEPENALDKRHREHLALQIKEHMREGGIVVIATHNAELWPYTQNLDMDQFTRRAA